MWLNKSITRRANVVGIFPNDPAIPRLVGSQLLEQREEWQLERRRFSSQATMASISELEEALELIDSYRQPRWHKAPAQAPWCQLRRLARLGS